MNHKSGNMLLTFILMVGLSMIVGSVVYLTSTGIKNIGYYVNRAKALYIADGGLQKALWYLKTPASQGGMGSEWRTTGYTENFSGGSFTIYVAGAPQANVIITSEGTFLGIKRTLTMNICQYPSAFDYASFGLSDLTADIGSLVSGDVFCDGNVVINSGARVVNGKVVVTAGHSISGAGSWTQGTMPNPAPGYPNFDPSYYNGEITTAQAIGSSQTNIAFLNLAGGTVYFQNDIKIHSLAGPGAVVAGGGIEIMNNCSIGDNVKLICNDDLNIQDNVTIGSSGLLFAKNNIIFDDLSAPGTFGPGVALIAPNANITIGNNWTMDGIIYCGKVTLGDNASFSGSIQSGTLGSSAYNSSSRLTHDRTKYPGIFPIGLQAGYGMIEDTWEEQQ